MRDFHRLIILGTIGLLWISAVQAMAQSAITQPATGVTDVTATMRGSVNPASPDFYRYVTFDYGPTINYGTSVNCDQYQVIGTAPVPVTVSPPGLLPNTTYHYRIVVSTGFSLFGGRTILAVSDDMSFTTGPPTTLPAFQSISLNIVGDTLGAFIIWNTTSGASPATTTLEYGTTTSYGLQVTLPDTMATNTLRSSAQINATGLTPGTLYHYRINVTNEQGTTSSADGTFTTTLPANVTTGDASNVTSFTASVAGSADPLAHTLGMYFEYGPTTDYGSLTPATIYQISGAGTKDLSTTLAGLLPGMTYHYRLKGADFWNGGGYYYGEDKTFNTPSNIAALAATAVTDLSATANGTVDTGTGGGSYSFVFEYGTTASYGSTKTATLVQNDTLNPNLKIVSVSLSQLLPDTVYHYRLRSASSGHVTIGEDVVFTTSAAATPPTLGTPGASSFPRFTSSADLNISIQSGSSTASVVFDYGLDTSYGSQAVSPAFYPPSSSAVAGVTLSGLAPGTTYHIRARATNSEGSTNSPDSTFTTLPVPDVTTSAATSVGGTWATLNGTYHMHEGSYTVTFDYGPTIAYGSSIAPFSGFFTAGGSGGGGIILGGGIIIGGNNTNSTQSPSAAVIALSPLTTYHYRLKLADSIGNTYYGADATFTTVPPVEAWRQYYFGTAANSGTAADSAAPDGDGLANLLKYALGLPPGQPGTAPTPQIKTDSGSRYLSLTFNRLAAATDITYEVQAADDLAGPWTTIATAGGGAAFSGSGLVGETWGNGFLISPTAYPSGTSIIEVRDIVSMEAAPRRFMRLRVTR